MKSVLFYFLVLISINATGFAQNIFPANGPIGIGTNNPHASSLLEVHTKSKGVLFPRMTLAQKNAIPFPATGLLIYQTDGLNGFYFYDGGWQRILFSAPTSTNTTNTNLANPTAIHHHLLPGKTNLYNLGTTEKAWRNLYLRGGLYLDGFRFIMSKATVNSVYIGAYAGNDHTSGIGNTVVGTLSLSENNSGNFNSSFGFQTLYHNTEGLQNTALGYQALSNNLQGFGNTATGFQSLYNNTEGLQNTANGIFSLFSNTTGSDNTAVGIAALLNNTDAGGNTAVGNLAMVSNSIGSSNTALGKWSLFFSTESSENTAVGYSAGDYTSEPSQATFLGALTTADENLNNITAIGYGAYAFASDQVVIGNTTVTDIGGFSNWKNFSDGRFKKNIKEEVPGLSFINKLRPVTYNLDIDHLDNEMQLAASQNGQDTKLQQLKRNAALPESIIQKEARKEITSAELKAKREKSKVIYTGFIAQEVEQVAKELNYDFSGVDKPKGDKGFYGLRYAEFVVPLVKAVQELDKKTEEIKALKSEIDLLKEKFASLEALVQNNMPQGNNRGTGFTSAFLENNTPNPFTKGTIIRYYLPPNTIDAKLIITDMKGVVIKTYHLNTKGKGEVNVNSVLLATGTYTYSLWVDGIKADSKQLVVYR